MPLHTYLDLDVHLPTMCPFVIIYRNILCEVWRLHTSHNMFYDDERRSGIVGLHMHVCTLQVATNVKEPFIETCM